MKQEDSSNIKKMSIFAPINTILIWCVGISGLGTMPMSNRYETKDVFETYLAMFDHNNQIF